MTNTTSGRSRFLSFRTATIAVFVVLFIYLLLRAYFVEPLKDELMTFFFFIETGRITGPDIILDANNHLLNSFSGHFINSHFPGNFFLLRLPNVVAFAFYFWGVFSLVKDLGKPWQRFIVLLAVICVPFTLEYFACTRGYGLALGFFVWMLYYCRKWLRDPSPRLLIITYAFAWVTILSNLTYMTSGCICGAILVAYQLFNYKHISSKKHIIQAIIHLAFFCSLIPFVQFAADLKEAGAFYYGSLDGFWAVTCRSVLRYTLFYDAEWMKYPVGLFFLVLIIIGFMRLFRHRLVGFSKLPESIYYFFLTGNVAAIFFMAKVLKVNYPEDRVAMHLVPLTILLVAALILQSRRFQNAILLFLFFPVVFLFKINLDSSVISPDDRMNTALYETVRKNLGKESTLGGYHTMPLMWTYMERRQPGAHIEMEALPEFSRYHTIVLTKDDLPKLPSDLVSRYELIAEHRPSHFKVYKRRKELTKTPAFDVTSSFSKTNAEYLSLGSVMIADSMRGKPYFLNVKTNLKLELPYRDVMLAFATIGKDGQSIRYEQYQLNYGFGTNKTTIPIDLNYIYDRFTEDETEIRIYIWNPQRSNMYFYDGLVRFYEIATE